MGVWAHIILESYCTFRWASKKKWRLYPLKDETIVELDKSKPSVIKNKGYIPKSKRPEWCKSKNKELCPQYKCLVGHGMCPFLAYTDADKKDYKKFYDALFKKGNTHGKKRNIV